MKNNNQLEVKILQDRRRLPRIIRRIVGNGSYAATDCSRHGQPCRVRAVIGNGSETGRMMDHSKTTINHDIFATSSALRHRWPWRRCNNQRPRHLRSAVAAASIQLQQRRGIYEIAMAAASTKEQWPWHIRCNKMAHGSPLIVRCIVDHGSTIDYKKKQQ